jgi:hypothetical protein
LRERGLHSDRYEHADGEEREAMGGSWHTGKHDFPYRRGFPKVWFFKRLSINYVPNG